MINPWWRPGGLNYPILMLLALWAVDTTVLMFRDPAAAAVLIAMVPVLVVLVARST